MRMPAALSSSAWPSKIPTTVRMTPYTMNSPPISTRMSNSFAAADFAIDPSWTCGSSAMATSSVPCSVRR